MNEFEYIVESFGWPISSNEFNLLVRLGPSIFQVNYLYNFFLDVLYYILDNIELNYRN